MRRNHFLFLLLTPSHCLDDDDDDSLVNILCCLLVCNILSSISAFLFYFSLRMMKKWIDFNYLKEKWIEKVFFFDLRVCLWFLSSNINNTKNSCGLWKLSMFYWRWINEIFFSLITFGLSIVERRRLLNYGRMTSSVVHSFIRSFE